MESKNKRVVLIIDPDRKNAAGIRDHLVELLPEIEVQVTHDIDEGLAFFREENDCTCVLVGENLSPGKGAHDGFDLVKQMFQERPEAYVVGFFSSDESLVKLSKAGCYHTVKVAKGPDYHTNILHMVLDAGKPDKHYSASYS